MATNEMETENINQTTPLDDTHAVTIGGVTIPVASPATSTHPVPVTVTIVETSPSSTGFAAQLHLQQLDYRQVLLPSNPVLGPLVTDVCRPTFRTLLLTTILQLPAEQMSIAL